MFGFFLYHTFTLSFPFLDFLLSRMWNFDHFLFRPCSPNTHSDPLSNYITNQTHSSRHSIISNISCADEATETNVKDIEIRQKTDIDLLISKSWPKSTRNMCDEKKVINFEHKPRLSSPCPSHIPPDILMSEFKMGNPNHVTNHGNDFQQNNLTNPDIILNDNHHLLPRPPSDPELFSTSFVRYIDWGPAEFIDDF